VTSWNWNPALKMCVGVASKARCNLHRARVGLHSSALAVLQLKLSCVYFWWDP
jgi:hypothetical protein